MLEQLTPTQLQLFRDLGRLTEEGSLIAPFIPIPAGIDEYTLYLRGNRNYRLHSYDDLNALCAAGLLDWQLTRMGAYKQFSLSKVGIVCYRATLVRDDDGDTVSKHDHSNRPISMITQQLKSSVRQILRGAILDSVLRDIDRVTIELQKDFINAWRVQRAVQAVGEAITKRFEQGSLMEVSDVAICFGRWCQATAREVEQQAESTYV